MTVQNDKIVQIRLLIEEWANKQGHDSCWFYPDIFRQIALIVEAKIKTQNLPPLEEFKVGCCRYQKEIYGIEN